MEVLKIQRATQYLDQIGFTWKGTGSCALSVPVISELYLPADGDGFYFSKISGHNPRQLPDTARTASKASPYQGEAPGGEAAGSLPHGDPEWHASRFKKAPRTHKGNPDIIQEEALGQRLPGQNIPIPHHLVRQPFESRRPHSGIMSSVKHNSA